MTPELAIQANLAQIKEWLPIPYVMERYGHEPEFEDSDGKLHYVNPFRDDHDPSFDVFQHQIAGRDAPEIRWGDFAEGRQGDVIDLIQRFEPEMGRAAALDHARTLLRDLALGDWDGPVVEVRDRREFDVAEASTLLDRGLPAVLSPAWDELTRTRPALRGVTVPTVRTHPDTGVLIYGTYTADGELVGLRYRREDGSKFAMPGSRNAFIRMEVPSGRPVFLTEGETDTWSAWAHLPDFEVLGVPGVGNPPASLAGTELDGRDVYICFDPDEAGEAGMRKWADFLRSRKASVFPIILPEGRDVASLQPEQVRALPGEARAVLEAPDTIVQLANYFAVPNKDGKLVRITNWGFRPTMRLRGEDGTTSYRGRLSPHGLEVVLPSVALRSYGAFQQWMGQHELGWWGGQNEQQQLIALLGAQSVYLPEGRYTTQFGLTAGTFVWGGGRVGDANVEYLPPQHALATAGAYEMPDVEVDRVAVFEALYRSQSPEVMGPMLAWLAVAPLRTRFKEFPILSVSGASGTGKTTLMENVGQAFYGGIPSINLTSSTPYGVESFIDSSNGLPLWIDEYRPGARAEAKTRLDQLLRDLFTGQSSLKGGMANDTVKLKEIRTTAPLIVSGEDRFTETSHVDRMVLIRLTKEGQGDLRRLYRTDSRGWGRAYLTYLTQADPREFEPTAPVFAEPWLDDEDDERLRSRQALAMAVLRYGWLLLEEFVTDYGRNGYDFPELVLTGVVDEAIEESSESPELELIRLAYENRANLKFPAVWLDGQKQVCVSSANLLKAANEYRHIILPVSSARGMTALLVDAHGGVTAKRTVPHSGQQARVVVLPRGILGTDDSPEEA